MRATSVGIPGGQGRTMPRVFTLPTTTCRLFLTIVTSLTGATLNFPGMRLRLARDYERRATLLGRCQ